MHYNFNVLPPSLAIAIHYYVYNCFLAPLKNPFSNHNSHQINLVNERTTTVSGISIINYIAWFMLSGYIVYAHTSKIDAMNLLTISLFSHAQIHAF